MTTLKRKILMATAAILITTAAAALGNRAWAEDVEGNAPVSNGRDYHISLIEAARTDDPVIHRAPEAEKKMEEDRAGALKEKKDRGPLYERKESRDSFQDGSMKKDDHREWKDHRDRDDRHMDRDDHDRYEKNHKKYKKEHRLYKDDERHIDRDGHDRYERHHKKYKKEHRSYKRDNQERQQRPEDAGILKA